MSISAISGALNFHYQLSSQQTKFQQASTDFQKLGQDLQSGNLAASQSDFAQLQQLAQGGSTSSSNPVAQAFNQLGQDLQSGNVTAAQQDFATIQQDLQNAASTQGHHHHHHGGGGGQESSSSTSQFNTILQAFSQLGQSLQAGNLSAAQTAYTTLQQDFQQFATTQGLDSPQPTTGAVNATA
jgi:outer membrane protein assembly factor BamD (BamD/ComL family)